MTAAAGFPTLRLVRVRIGNILLGDLPPGETRVVDSLSVFGIELPFHPENVI
jgi:23S rRNA pseudouridine2457 synthase